MCGITGFTHLGRSVEGELIRRATMTLVHRGPDEQNIFNDADVSLGSVRLKIIDLSTGQQPMTSADGSTVVVYNGEVYNYTELRAELEGLGYRFRSHSDTEVILNAFLAWDTGSFKRLRGMFAIAFWQPARKRLMVVRDRLGIKPL